MGDRKEKLMWLVVWIWFAAAWLGIIGGCLLMALGEHKRKTLNVVLSGPIPIEVAGYVTTLVGIFLLISFVASGLIINKIKDRERKERIAKLWGLKK